MSDASPSAWVGLIVAGGQGSRMGPEIPKPLVKIGTRSLIERNIDKLVAAGARAIYLAVHHKADQIVADVEHNLDVPIPLHWIRESSPLGTIGALGCMRDLDMPVLSVNGDLLSGIDLGAMQAEHYRSKAQATLAVHAEHHRLRLGEVLLADDSRVVGYAEKPIKVYTISSGTTFFEPDVIRLIATGERLDVPDLIQRALDHGLQLHAYRHVAPWVDVNDRHDLAAAAQLVAEQPNVF